MIKIEYIGFLIYLVITIIIALVLVLASYSISPRAGDIEKLSAYECGFEPFDDARKKFDIQFYLIAILFIIFDLEIAFLFPWALCLSQLSMYGFWSMVLFLMILTVGFVYEWKKGALEWH